MVVALTFTEGGRNKLGIISAVLSILLSFSGFCLIIIGIYIQVKVNDQLILLENYNDGLLPNFLISVGTLMFIIDGLMSKFAYDTGFADTSNKFRLAMVPLIVVMSVFCIVVLVASITVSTHRESIESGLHGGLTRAMKRYKDNMEIKVTLDILQMGSRCCGSKSYKDWFKIGWVNPEFVDKAKFGKYVFGDELSLTFFLIIISLSNCIYYNYCLNEII